MTFLFPCPICNERNCDRCPQCHSEDTMVGAGVLECLACEWSREVTSDLERINRRGAHRAVAILNELLALDGDAIQALTDNRVPGNEAIATHPTAQVGGDKGIYRIGLIGILNAIFGKRDDGWGCVAAVYEEDGTLVRFRVLSDEDMDRFNERAIIEGDPAAPEPKGAIDAIDGEGSE